jgi:hypothetical protein
VIGNDFHADVSCFPNITDNDLNLAVPFGPLAQLVDVVGIHADCFKYSTVFVAVVLHPLQLIQISSALLVLADFGGKVIHSVAPVVFEVLFRSDVASNDVVVVTAHVH